MVLNKQDRQEKYRYKLKHGLIKKEAPTIKPKWSGKQKTSDYEKITLDVDEMTSDWDSEVDDDIVNHFYPQIGDEIVAWNEAQKRAIKRQLIEDLKRQRDEAFNESEGEDADDGIYLGSEENKPQVKLDQFLPEIAISRSTKKANRKMPKAQQTDNLLEEYGLDSYSKTVKNVDDYDDVYYKKQANRKLEDIPISQLAGFRIGEDSLSALAKSQREKRVEKLSEEEMRKDQERTEKDKQNRFYSEMKKKFGPQKSSGPKVLDLNNFSNENKAHVDFINNRLLNQESEYPASTVDEALDEILGTKFSKEEKKKPEHSIDEFDGFIESLGDTRKTIQPNQRKPVQKNVTDEDFLDSLL